MNYPKPVMCKSELRRMGFSEPFLDKAYAHHGQTFAWKEGNHRQSKIMYDTEGFEKYRKAHCGVR